MSADTEPDFAGAALTLQRIEVLARRLRKQLGDPETPIRHRRRAITLRQAALDTLRADEWFSLEEWEAAMRAVGYSPPANAKRPDQTRRSLASLVARNRHQIDADGKGRYRLRPIEEVDPFLT
jgi:hypothetical protein